MCLSQWYVMLCFNLLGDNTHHTTALHPLLLYTGGDYTGVCQDRQKVAVLELY